MHARIGKHPVHPMLIVFPLGLWVFGFVCHTVFQAGGDIDWRTAAVYCYGGGIVGAFLAALAGLLDLLSIPESPARRTGYWHAASAITTLGLFAVTFGLLLSDAAPAGTWFVALLGFLMSLVVGWLGGSMVYVHGVAVSQEAFRRKQERHGGDQEHRPPGLAA